MEGSARWPIRAGRPAWADDALLAPGCQSSGSSGPWGRPTTSRPAARHPYGPVFRPLWVAVYTAVATAPRERFPALAAGVGGCWWRWWRSGSDRARRERAAQAGQRRADKERLRVARELHDVVSHSIAMINFRAGVALHVIDRRPEEAKAALVAIRQGSAGAMQELRAALGVLRHPGGSPRTPGPGLGQLAELVEGVAGAGRAVEIVAEGDPGELPPAVDLAAYRAVQESLTNVVKHARATTCSVDLRRKAGEAVLTIQDDGAGFDPSQKQGDAEPRGLGLIGIRERALQLGGRVTVDSEPLHGTRVTVVLPFRPRADVSEREDELAAPSSVTETALPEWSRG